MNLLPIRTRREGGPATDTDRAWDKLHEGAIETLKRRLEHHGLEPDTCPLQDVCLLYRIPNEYKGAVAIPEQFAQRHDAEFDVGLLIFAGVEAMGVLETHGVLLGDYCQFAKYGGEQAAANRIQQAIQQAHEEGRVNTEAQADALGMDLWRQETSKKKLIRIQAKLIHQSVDLFERRHGAKPTMQIVRVIDAKQRVLHTIEPVIENIL